MDPSVSQQVNYLDTLALSLAAAATWWREQLARVAGSMLTSEQLASFERHLCLELASLLMRNAIEGLSWRSWGVRVHRHGPDQVLAAAALRAGIQGVSWPAHTRMWLQSTADQIVVVTCGGHYQKAQQVWPLPTLPAHA